MSEINRVKTIIQKYEEIVGKLGRLPLADEVPGELRDARIDGVPVLVEACPTPSGIEYREVGKGCGPVVINPIIDTG